MSSIRSFLQPIAIGSLLGATAAGLANPEEVAPESIPAIAFFQPPDLLNPQLSPNGRFIGKL